ncbi:MAG TPA: hypothetical protein PL182_07505 [Pseudobdellovibrionaceae bacterium]|mgnify:CR=1 FL=1|nr:hypothetical protein [Pseudobdellovibrionaceae bacterium]
MNLFVSLILLCSSSAFAKPAAALNPVEPSTLCERFIREKDKGRCQEKAKVMDLDWYAATVCDLIESDDQFLRCWSDVDGKIYSPPDLVDCASDDLTDEARRACLVKISLKTAPSSRIPASIYQPLKKKN